MIYDEFMMQIDYTNLCICCNRLFEIAPELVKLFPFKDENITDENPGLRKHGLSVMESIDAAIGLLEKPEELEEVLIELGIVHHMSEVQLESFGVSQCDKTVGRFCDVDSEISITGQMKTTPV